MQHSLPAMSPLSIGSVYKNQYQQSAKIGKYLPISHYSFIKTKSHPYIEAYVRTSNHQIMQCQNHFLILFLHHTMDYKCLNPYLTQLECYQSNLNTLLHCSVLRHLGLH